MLPALYHAHHSLHPEDIPFWLDLATQHAAPILELGCGSGRVLLPLAGVAQPVFGLDWDYAMLAFLRQRLPDNLRSSVHIFQANFTNFHLSTQFSFILSPCNTFSTLESSTRRATLENVRRHLHPSGTFAVSLPNPALLERLPAQAQPEVEEIFPHPNSGEPVQVVSAWQRTAQHFTIHWHYDQLLPDGRVHRLSTQVKHALLPVQAYLQEMQQAGFSSFNLYGDYQGTPYSGDAPNLIILAT